MPTLNDVHSRLNATEVEAVVAPRSEAEVVEFVREAGRRGTPLCVFGGRHAMGGQQFAEGAVAVDTTWLVGESRLDVERGLLTVGAGAMWPAVIAASRGMDGRGGDRWGIRQKQTGADDLTLGGSVAANGHGRGLTIGPIVDDVERLRVVLASGEAVECSRERDAELFSLVCGGYGLFGIVTEVTLRLAPRVRLRRLVDVIDLDDALNAVHRRVEEGCLYGDFQYAIDPADDGFLRRGVMACYRPAPPDAEVVPPGADLPRERWLELLALAHADKRRAFEVYSQHYLASHGRVYWSDAMQLSTYIPSYAEFLSEQLRGRAGADGEGARTGQVGGGVRESLMITELFVPPPALNGFMAAARGVLRERGVEDIYGTIRAIRRDTTTFLPWAREDAACVIFNLRTAHTPAGIERTKAAARALIDAALDRGGTFFLTYHRWATREQLLRAYPALSALLARKRELDPAGVLQSTWYRSLVATMGDR